GLKTVEGEGLNDTRLKREESGEVAAVDRDFLDLGVVDDAGDPALLCLHRLSTRLDCDFLRHLADLHRTGQLHTLCGVQVHIRVRAALETFFLGANVIGPRRKIERDVVAAVIGGGSKSLSGLLISDRDVRLGYDRARTVHDEFRVYSLLWLISRSDCTV